ncbi:hypothetical protein BS47DRAFT_1346094, partial [Hydnum rufescens UP504]
MLYNYDGALNVTATEESTLAEVILRELESRAHAAGKGENGEFCHLLHRVPPRPKRQDFKA